MPPGAYTRFSLSFAVHFEVNIDCWKTLLIQFSGNVPSTGSKSLNHMQILGSLNIKTNLTTRRESKKKECIHFDREWRVAVNI